MPKTVLIVEDEPNITESLAFLLERDGFDVVSVDDGARALGMVQERSPDVVILDVMLPNVSGFDVLKAIRDRSDLSHTPVLMLTAKGQAKDRSQAEALGADTFMTKPFSNVEIIEEVRRLAQVNG